MQLTLWPDLAQFAFCSTQWRDQPQFVLAGFRLTAQEGDPAAVGRPDRAVVVARVLGQRQREPMPICWT